MSKNSRNINPGKVRSIRIERGLTQEDLAEAANLSVRTLQRIESGGSARANTRARVATALRVSLDELRLGERFSLNLRAVGGRVTLIASTKGGTGRTTLAISLAGLLEQAGHRVCVVDFDRFRGTSRYMAWAQILSQPVPVHILEKGGPVEAASRLVAGLGQGFDHVIIDSSAYEDTELFPLALMADRILLTTDHPRLDLGITHRVRMWLDVATLGRGAISIVRTRASKYAAHRRRDAAFLQQIGLPLCKTVLHARAAYTYAAARGKPVTVDDPHGFAAAEVRQLGYELSCIHELPSAAVRDRHRTGDDLRYLEASLRMCHPIAVAQVPSTRRKRRR